MSQLVSNNKRIAASVYHSVILKNDMTVWVCGSNNSGQLGNDEAGERSLLPQKIPKLDNVVMVSTGYDHCVALKADGTVWIWGEYDGEWSGKDTSVSSQSPVEVKELSEIVDIDCGSNFTLALQNRKRVWAWGNNFYGSLGTGIFGNEHSSTIPVQITTLQDITAVSAGDGHCLALQDNGTAWAWGDNTSNQLGFGIPFPGTPIGVMQGPKEIREYLEMSEKWYEPIPKPIPDLPYIRHIVAGWDHSLCIDDDGFLWVWGKNTCGQLGIGTREQTLGVMRLQSISNVVAIAGGENHSLAVTDDGSVWSWGDNSYGQLGNGSAGRPVPYPSRIPALKNVTAVAAGSNYSIAVIDDEAVWAWGNNESGQLGTGTTQDSWVPVQVVWPQE